MLATSRRNFIFGAASAGIFGAASAGIFGAASAGAAFALGPRLNAAATAVPPFRVAVITDEISQDFEHACSVVRDGFGLEWVELRGMWNKNLQGLTPAELAEAEKILAKYNLRVTDIASPLFKVDWPEAPRSAYSPRNDSFGANYNFKQQDEVLERSIALAKRFKTDKVRCFDYWRLDDAAPYRRNMNDKLRDAAATAGKQGVLLVLENEFECNTATGREAAQTLAAVQSPHLALNWDPANAVMRGELDAFPGGWELLPKDRIRHCHVKNAAKDSAGKIQWSPVGTGYIDWAAQFRALRKAGYSGAVSLETHWHGPTTPEAATRTSWAGMKQALNESGAI